MKAIVRTQYGTPDVLQFTDVEKPTPKDNEVLIKLYAASVNPLDLFHLRGAPWNRHISGLRTPKQAVIGCDIAGRVESVGRDVKQFQSGDAVFGVTGFAGGGFAEYACAPEAKLARKPANLSFEDAAAVPIAAVTALQALRDKGRIQPGQKVLIDGASGGVGTFAIQIAKSFGAEVTAVCSTRNVDIARSLGADHVIDYTKEDFRQRAQRYDLIVGGQRPSFSFRLQAHAASRRDLRRGGRRCASTFPSDVIGTRTIPDREQEGPLLYSEHKPEGSNFPERPHRSRESCTRNRWTSPTKRRSRRDPLSRRRPRARQNRVNREA